MFIIRHRLTPFLILASMFIVILFRTAWIADDAMITFRTVHNFVKGYGLVWNVGERVQTYTHPLWMFVLSGVYFFTREPFFTGIFTSMAFSIAAVFTLLLPGHKQTALSVVVPMCVLMASKSFVDYASSGLENPLTFFLLAVFLQTWQRRDTLSAPVITIAFIIGLLTFNRPDTLLLALPCLGCIFAKHRSIKSSGLLLLGLSPIILWEIFSLIYYGFPLPNTAYAKMNHGLPRGMMLAQGVHYFANSICRDPITLVTIFSGLCSLFLRHRRQDWPLGLGILLYLGYTLYLGGDHMSGRFFTAPFFISVHLISTALLNAPIRLSLLLIPIPIILGAVCPHPPALTGSDFGKNRPTWGDVVDLNGIADERAYFFRCTGLFSDRRPFTSTDCGKREWIRQAEERGINPIVAGGVGFIGFYAGPNHKVLDTLAIGDPLLSRFPCISQSGWRPGHFARNIPKGYKQSIRNGTNEIVEPGTHRYYQKLKTIISGPILNTERFKTIIKMNLKQYDNLLPHTKPSVYKPYIRQLSKLKQGRTVGSICNRENMSFFREGITIHMGSTANRGALEITVSDDADFHLDFIKNDMVEQVYIESRPGREGNIVRHCIPFPKDETLRGWNTLHVQGDMGHYGCLESVRLLDGC